MPTRCFSPPDSCRGFSSRWRSVRRTEGGDLAQPRPPRTARESGEPQRAADQPAHSLRPVQGCSRVLKDDLQRLELGARALLGTRRQRTARELDHAALVGRRQSEQQFRQRALAAARFADQSECLAQPKLDGDVMHRLERLARDQVRFRQMLRAQERRQRARRIARHVVRRAVRHLARCTHLARHAAPHLARHAAPHLARHAAPHLAARRAARRRSLVRQLGGPIGIETARHMPVGPDRRRNLAAAALRCIGAALDEDTAVGDRSRSGQETRNGLEPSLGLAQAVRRHAAHQPHRVGMTRIAEHPARRPFLDQFARVQHAHPIAHPRDHGKAVADE